MMQKKKLLALTVPPLITLFVPYSDTSKLKREGYGGKPYIQKITNYLYTSTIDLSTGEEILIIDLYKPSGPHIWRYFINGDGAYFRWIDEEKRISKAGMDNILGYCYNTKYLYQDATKKTICDFLEIDEEDVDDPLRKIAEINQSHKEFKLKTKLDKIRKSIDNHMLEIREIPKPVHDWIVRDLMKFSRYIFYEYEAKKKMSGFCTHCKSDVVVEHPKHRTLGKCPNCKSPITYIALGKYLRGEGFKDKEQFAYYQKTKKGFCLRYFEVLRDFSCSGYKYYKSASLWLEEKSRIFFEYSELKGFEKVKSYEYGNFRQTGEYRFYESYWNERDRNNSRIYPSNLNDIFKIDNSAKHIDYNGIARNCGVLNLKQVINHPYAYRAFENIYKSRLYSVAADIINKKSAEDDDFNFSATNIKAALNINKDELRTLQKLNLNLEELKLYKLIQQKERRVNASKFKELCKLDVPKNRILRLLEYCTMHRLLRYINEQMPSYKKIQTSTWNTPHPAKDTADDWLDYIGNAQLLEMNLKDHGVLYPKNLKKAHDDAYQIVNEAEKSKNGLQIPAIARMEKELNSKYYFESKKLIIRAPREHHELIDEGEKLKHCVATYAKEVARGETIILFIRQKLDPDTPYFTLELDPTSLKIDQCRGMSNKAYGDDVAKFMEQWKKAKLLKLADTVSA